LHPFVIVLNSMLISNGGASGSCARGKGAAMELDLSGKVVVVTGAARGIGRAITETFETEGAVVAALDLDSPALRELSHPFVCDVSESAAVSATVDAIEREFGRIDVLVNNAGINAVGAVDEIADELWDRCFDINVGGVFRMCKAVAPVMKRQGSGRIINAASFAAIIPSVESAAYAASKAAVVQLTRVLAGELGPWNVTVNAYAPGMIPTSINGFAEMPEAAQARLLDTLSLRRWGSPADVAELLVFLSSDAASYITGALIDVSGGKFATQFPSRAYERAASSAS
jgi:3-oxoacyl-[acyl-carrier protein] reductase